MKIPGLAVGLLTILSQALMASNGENVCLMSYENTPLGAAVAESGITGSRYYSAMHIVPRACLEGKADCRFQVTCLGREGSWERTVRFTQFLASDIALFGDGSTALKPSMHSQGVPHHCVIIVPWNEAEMLKRDQYKELIAKRLSSLSDTAKSGPGLVAATEYALGNVIPDSIKTIPIADKRKLYAQAFRRWGQHSHSLGPVNSYMGNLSHKGWHVIHSRISRYRVEGNNLYSDCDGWYGGSGSGVFDADGHLLAITQGFADEVSYIFRASAAIGMTRHSLLAKGVSN